MNPPKALFQSTGNHETGSTASVEVRLCRDPQGNIWSFHQSATGADDQILLSWPGHGVRAIAHGLLLEALRREAYLCVLTKLTKDPALVTQYAKGDPSIRQAVEEGLALAMRDQLEATLPKLIPDVAKEILNMVSNPDSPDTQKA